MTGGPAQVCHAERTRSYHHGDLRRALLAAALDVIRAEGPSGLSLRDLARRAGVSHAAPAHHFGDRTGLLTAIAAEGYGLLASALREAADPQDAGARYVRFAAEHPAHFGVMFVPDLLRADDGELVAAKAAVGDGLRAAVAGAPAGAADPRLVTIATWSLAQGFATLLLSRDIDELLGDSAPETVMRELGGALLRAAV